MHKAGFVNIVGNPNVGKSTLMNQLVGERISIATFKAQTTRHRIMGIVNTPDYQIVFSDTPGVHRHFFSKIEADPPSEIIRVVPRRRRKSRAGWFLSRSLANKSQPRLLRALLRPVPSPRRHLLSRH